MFVFAASPASQRHHSWRTASRYRLAIGLVCALAAPAWAAAQPSPAAGSFPVTQSPFGPGSDPSYQAYSQDDRAPGHVAVVEGTVSLEREGEQFAATAGEPIVAGDVIRTDRGRVDLWFDDGSGLALDDRSLVEWGDGGRLRLVEGRLFLTTGTSGVRVDTTLGAVDARAAGEYVVRILSTGQGDYLELTVLRGTGDLIADGGTMPVRPGERAYARPRESPSYPERVNTARLDDFQAWASGLREGRRGRATSTRYLPSELQMYGGTFDRDGSWEYDATYGYVWYPVVDTGWRPYYNGYWRPLPRYGWTWVASDRWGWPTHHYGRWGYSRSRWFWIPQRRWAPAWVSWASAADYVSWCPLGFDNRPVFGFSLNVGNTWIGWTVLPRPAFGARNQFVSRYAYDGRRLPRSTAFALHGQAPIPPPAFRDRRDGRDNRAFADRGRAGGDRVVMAPDPGAPNAGIYHGPGGLERGRAGDGGPRGARRGSREDQQDRPTPQAPRNGIYVDPGVPRAGDRTEPRSREVMPPPDWERGSGRARGRDRDGDPAGDRRRGADRQTSSAPGIAPGPPATPATPTPPPGPPGGDASAPAPESRGASAGRPVRRWGDSSAGRPAEPGGQAVERRGAAGADRGERGSPRNEGNAGPGGGDGGGARRRGR